MAMSLETRPKAENILSPQKSLTRAGSHQRHVTCERQMALPIHRFLAVCRARRYGVLCCKLQLQAMRLRPVLQKQLAWADRLAGPAGTKVQGAKRQSG